MTVTAILTNVVLGNGSYAYSTRVQMSTLFFKTTKLKDINAIQMGTNNTKPIANQNLNLKYVTDWNTCVT